MNKVHTGLKRQTTPTKSKVSTNHSPEPVEQDNSKSYADDATFDVHSTDLANPRKNSPQTILQLQRLVGNRTVARMLKNNPSKQPATTGTVAQQPMPSNNKSIVARFFKETTTKYQKYDDFFDSATSLRDVDGYAKKQADWHAGPDLDDGQRDEIRNFLSFVRDANILAACGDFDSKETNDLIKADVQNIAYLKEYANVVKTQEPFELSVVTDVDAAIDAGKAIKKLRAKMGDPLLATAMTENWFKEIVRLKRVDQLTDYYEQSDPQPIFQAERGRDMSSFLELSVTDKQNPLDYHTTNLNGYVRNFHRFTKNTLEGLKTNYADKSKAKPLTVILHTTFDHNGAFHRDPKLEAVVTNTNIHTLMVEGKESMGEMRSQIGPLATEYGKNGKIDQIMLAGHGNSRSMELTGTMKEDKGKLAQVSDNIDLDSNKDKTEALFDEILNYMDKEDPGFAKFARLFTREQAPVLQPHRRVVFNACLTNSNQVGDKITSVDVAQARKEVTAYIRQNASLATYFNQKIEGTSAPITALGANASVGQIDLLDSTDGLDISYAKDPFVTKPKLEYMEHGKEVAGVLRATLEVWGQAQNSTKQRAFNEALQRRISSPATAWDDVVVKYMFKLMDSKAFKDKGEIMRLLGTYGEIAGHLKKEHSCKVSSVNVVLNFLGEDKAKTLLADLSQSDEWKANKFIPLVFLQGWLKLDPSKGKDFLDLLASDFPCNTAKKHVDMAYLEKNNLTKDLLTGSASVGKTRLALLGVLASDMSEESKAYLIKQLTDDKFTAPNEIETHLGGLDTADGILRRIGKLKDALEDGGSDSDDSSLPVKKPAKDANMQLKGGGSNKMFVQSITKTGKVAVDNADVFPQPDDTSTRDCQIVKDKQVHVIGVTDDKKFLAIEHIFTDTKRGTGFVKYDQLTLN